ncbi:asparagine synthase (glutamine-hydrolyzing) [Allochromatium tepidum]|uniref:asparagine synthase (glutamine-hydrolyzing) n=1 Tax=Allochromatium tepidum TaxID=553982 RepID=A0ABM7QQ01_9GAMM|nr:asparagine synthase (glutamine-hydrolyzing) [Allochromatium tepidum]BCU08006.1 putative asparagine synthetase [glutamine-hydrolyzing] [Allochromatium tepidum]
MCGIYGLIGYPDTRSGHLLDVIGDYMRPRGPHGEGRYLEPGVALGMRRLSIIDLEHGWQPLKARDGQVVCFQNGEIYNHRELRRELQALGARFATAGDTEVLAHGYALWGLDGLLARLDGMYAIAILDRDRRELILARDRFGEKPLFYTQLGTVFAYSSDLLTLAALHGQDPAIDPPALERYLALHFTPGRRTIFSTIRRVLPGELLRVRLDEPAVIEHRRYFVQPLGTARAISDDALAELVEQSVTSRLVADVPVGVFLSGGLDSSIVAAVAARAKPAIDTFSMGFTSARHDESPFARAVAQHVGSRHHHFEFRGDDFIELLPQVARALDEPVGDQAMLPLYRLCREAAAHVSVVLAGEGADEIFAGYGYYQAFAPGPGLAGIQRRLLSRRPLHPDLKRLIRNPHPATPSGFPLLTDMAGRQALLEPEFQEQALDDWESQLMVWLETAQDPLQRATAADLATWLPDDLLVKFDRMSMAHSLEGRAPFLAPALVDAALHLPARRRRTGAESKVALRRVARRWLPPDILKRRKQGFVLPMRQWLVQWFDRHGATAAYLDGRELPGLCGTALNRRLDDERTRGFPSERLVFALVLLLEWRRSADARIGVLRRDYDLD